MNKGFTLIELLAVIVILAIIATIATPIVLSIIEDIKKSAGLRSAEYYLSALETTIAISTLNNQDIKDGTYSILENGNICLEEYAENTNTCSNELVVEVKGEKASSGAITIKKGQISYIFLGLGNKEIIQNEKDELVYYESPCKRITGDKNTPGSKYECEVKPGVKYNFYVLSQEENGTTTLIMDRNINSDGTPTTKAIKESEKDSNEGIYNLVAWLNQDDYETAGGQKWDDWEDNNTYGPITVMKFLYNATKDWINVPALNYEYKDIEWQESLGVDMYGGGYESFISEKGVGKINGVKFTEEEPLRARMPIFSAFDDRGHVEVSQKKSDNSNIYLYHYLDVDCYDDDFNVVSCEEAGYIDGIYEEGNENIIDIEGYWTLGTIDGPDDAYRVQYSGYVDSNALGVDDVNTTGVRPVINVKL